jgi:hypothetical protein
MEAVSTGLSPTMTVPSGITPITNRPANSTPLMARASDAAVKGMERVISLHSTATPICLE